MPGINFFLPSTSSAYFFLDLLIFFFLVLGLFWIAVWILVDWNRTDTAFCMNWASEKYKIKIRKRIFLQYLHQIAETYEDLF